VTIRRIQPVVVFLTLADERLRLQMNASVITCVGLKKMRSGDECETFCGRHPKIWLANLVEICFMSQKE
jgi:hypothetical protein